MSKSNLLVALSLSIASASVGTLVKTSQGWRFKKRISWRDDDDISPFRPQSR
jgi:hypothetical protein